MYLDVPAVIMDISEVQGLGLPGFGFSGTVQCAGFRRYSLGLTD